MASVIKEMETIIKENEKLREENKKNEQIIISQRTEIIDIKKKYRDIEEKYRDIEENHNKEIKKLNEEWGDEFDEVENSNWSAEDVICDCLEFIMGDRGLITCVFEYLSCYYHIGNDEPYGATKYDEELWESLGGFETIIEENEKLKGLKKNNSDWAWIRGENIREVYSNYSKVKQENKELRGKLEEKYKEELKPEIKIKFPHMLKYRVGSNCSIGWGLWSQCDLLKYRAEQKNIELRIQLNEKNREISEILLSLDKYKQDKISRGQKIGSLISINKELYNNLCQITTEKDKIKIEKDKLKGSFDKYHKQSHEKQKIMQTELSKYKMNINKQDQLKKWFNENCDNFNYRLGKELCDIIS